MSSFAYIRSPSIGKSGYRTDAKQYSSQRVKRGRDEKKGRRIFLIFENEKNPPSLFLIPQGKAS